MKIKLPKMCPWMSVFGTVLLNETFTNLNSLIVIFHSIMTLSNSARSMKLFKAMR